jgi:hypothetical protein
MAMTYVYILLDWGGNIEDERLMTEAEAKEENKWLREKQPRFLRWAKKL